MVKFYAPQAPKTFTLQTGGGTVVIEFGLDELGLPAEVDVSNATAIKYLRRNANFMEVAEEE